MIIFDKEDGVYRSSFFSSTIVHGFGTKSFGDGRDPAVLKSYFLNRALSYKTIVIPHQTHSSNVHGVTLSNHPQPLLRIENADGLVTSEHAVALTIVTADCVPVIFADTKAGVIGIAHSGWKGTVENIAGTVIATMEQAGADRDRIVAAIGPAIGDCCYEIARDRYVLFQNLFGTDVFVQRGKNTFLNLTKATWLQLVRSGLPRHHIDYLPFCTSCQKDRFYSYHLARKLRGEMLHFIMLDRL